MADEQPSTKPSALSPNIKQFMDKALPPRTGGHVLATGEFHHLASNKNFLRQQAKQLSDPDGNNVGTIGLELPTYMNVLFWAAKDGNLPVPKEKEAQYLEQIMGIFFDGRMREETKLIYDYLAQRPDNQVVAFDARDTFASLSSKYAYIIDIIGLNPDLNQHLKTDFGNLHMWASEQSSKWAIYPEYRELRQKLSLAGLKPDSDSAESLWAASEVLGIVKRHPEYAKKLEELEYPGALNAFDPQRPYHFMSIDMSKFFKPKLSMDMRSAYILASATNPDRNTLTISGLSHISGNRSESFKSEGTFAGQLAHLGLNVTPAIIADTPDLRKMLDRSSLRDCAAQAPMNLIIVDKDVVLDASNRGAIEKTIKKRNADKNAVEVASTLLSSGTQLTCNDPKLPTVAQCAVREVQNKGSCEPPR